MEAVRAMTGYHETRLSPDPRRAVLWRALWYHHFRHRIGPDDTVLDLGCGYGEFINSVTARRRIALDAWPGFTQHIAAGVETIVARVTDLAALQDGCVDFALASNLFEHLTQPECAETLARLRPKLSRRGQLTLLQPNYRYAASEYFDDYTHVSVWSHVGLADFLSANGFEVTEVRPRFLPLTIKSRLPVSPILIGLYLRSPVKPFAKQMLLSARPR
jgi:SAM-dependent methyltransferase